MFSNELVIKCQGILIGERVVYANLVGKRQDFAHEKFDRALDRQKIKAAVVAFFKKSVLRGCECVDVVASIGTYRVDVGNITEGK